jgi:3-deoxy-manno-octulosonate cytidylyltransferase (CMP-KDO synthetase)
MRIVGIIPARLAAERLPRKPLAMLGDLPLVVRVLKQVERASKLDQVVVATDSQEIVDSVQAHGGQAVMTSAAHPSGTDRVSEAAGLTNADLVVNIQGDEPFVDPKDIDRVVEALEQEPGSAVTLMTPIGDESELHDPNAVKVVTGDRGQALYFSRAPIPFDRRKTGNLAQSHRHLGLYGYSTKILKRWTELPPHPLEEIEALEQLRALAAGINIRVLITQSCLRGIDTDDDLAWARERLEKLGEAAFPR